MDRSPHTDNNTQKQTEENATERRNGKMGYKWENSPAREVILDDLRSGVLPLENEDMTARQAWDLVYSHLIEFHGVEYAQYYRNLRSHRAQVKKQRSNISWMVTALEHDRRLHPARTKNARGEPIFHLTIAKAALEQDVKDKKHLKMKPAQLQKTRECYKVFRLAIFRQKIYQEIRAQKFNFYLNIKRAQKETKRRERRMRESYILS